MRLVSKIPFDPVYKRLMLYQAETGVYLFFYNTELDAGSVGDVWFADLEKAYAYAASRFGIFNKDWEVIQDPLPNCQDDFIQPVRVKGRDLGSPEAGSFEKHVNGKWMDFSH